jgi:hypothetical protein
MLFELYSSARDNKIELQEHSRRQGCDPLRKGVARGRAHMRLVQLEHEVGHHESRHAFFDRIWLCSKSDRIERALNLLYAMTFTCPTLFILANFLPSLSASTLPHFPAFPGFHVTSLPSSSIWSVSWRSVYSYSDDITEVLSLQAYCFYNNLFL